MVRGAMGGGGKPLALNEVRARAGDFVRAWEGAAGGERQEDQSFVRDLLAVFGVTETRAAAYQRQAMRASTGRGGFIDALIPGATLIEMKSAGGKLAAAERQGFDYLTALSDAEMPRYVLTSDFRRFRLHDLLAADGDAAALEFDLHDLPNHVEQLEPAMRVHAARLAPSLAEQEAASVQAAKLMASLYDALVGLGNSDDDDVSIFLVRTLFCLFADDSHLQGWPRGLFQRFIQERSSPDGSDLGPLLARLFQQLDTPPGRRGEVEHLLGQFPYVDGDVFAGLVKIPDFNAKTRAVLIKCCEFDWSRISPAVFGSLFQTVKSKFARREMGEHYTTEANIMRLIGPLFLDELRQRFERGVYSAKDLRALRRELGQLRFLDPACGCGNFLVVAYRELRALELAILVRLQELQAVGAGGRQARTSFGLALAFEESDLAVRREHFYGIEIEDWPAQIARTALHLADHQANLAMIDALGQGPTTLPLDKVNTITTANALRLDWTKVVPATKRLYIMGNPPFVGHKTKSADQAADLKLVWGASGLDYCTAWFAKAVQTFATGKVAGEFAFVTTNSITQGSPVARLFGYIFDHGWRIKFAHRTFAWTSEAPDAAAVHCVITGFDHTRRREVRVFDYPNPKGAPVERVVDEPLNGYLLPGPGIAVREVPQGRSLGGLPQADFGAMALDGSRELARAGKHSLLVDPEQYEQGMADPIAAQYVRRFVGAEELLQGRQRWCLWLEGANPADLTRSKVLKERVANCRAWRAAQKPTGDAFKYRDTPSLFRPNRQPKVPYLCVPRVSGESRRFLPAAHFPPEVIASDSTFAVADPEGFAFAVISSSMFMTWQKAVGGRLGSSLRFSSTLTWNTFPLPQLTAPQRAAIIAGGQAVLAARDAIVSRAKALGQSPPALAEMYHPLAMPPELLKAHAVLDKAVDAVFGLNKPMDDEQLAALFASYRSLTTP